MRTCVGPNTIVVAVLSKTTGIVLAASEDLSALNEDIGPKKYGLSSWVDNFSTMEPGVYRMTLVPIPHSQVMKINEFCKLVSL